MYLYPINNDVSLTRSSNCRAVYFKRKPFRVPHLESQALKNADAILHGSRCITLLRCTDEQAKELYAISESEARFENLNGYPGRTDDKRHLYKRDWTLILIVIAWALFCGLILLAHHNKKQDSSGQNFDSRVIEL